VIVLVFHLRKTIGGLSLVKLAQTLVYSLAASIPLGIVAFILRMPRVLEFVLQSKASILGALGFSFLMCAWSYYFIARWLKMPECEYLDRAMNKVQRKRA
jgi:hypothetical protein